MTTELVGTEVLTFPDGELWVACWIRRDIVSQGDSEEEAVRSLLEAIALTWLWHEEYSARGVNVAKTPSPPAEVVDEWQSRHADAHPTVSP